MGSWGLIILKKITVEKLVSCLKLREKYPSPQVFFLLDNLFLVTNSMVCGSKSMWRRNPILWRELTLGRLFSRLVIAMSIHFLSSLIEYWKQTPGHKYIYLHLRDKSKIPACDSADRDTLYQPRPFLASLTANLFHCHNPYSK